VSAITIKVTIIESDGEEVPYEEGML